MVKKVFLIVAICVGLIMFDQFSAIMAHKKISASDANFSENYKNSNINFASINKSDIPTCIFKYKFLIYGYQTCFIPNTSPNNKKEWIYEYIYHQPRPKLAIFFRGDSNESYYFQEKYLGERIATIHQNGTINRTPNRYRR